MSINKIGYFILLGVAFCFDYVIAETSTILEINSLLVTPFEWKVPLGIMSLYYLIAKEAVSILANLQNLNINVPFLTTAIKTYQDKIIKNGEEKNDL